MSARVRVSEKQYPILSTCHSPSARPAPGAGVPVRVICVSVRVPATKSRLDNYLLSLTRSEYNQVIPSTRDIPASLKLDRRQTDFPFVSVLTSSAIMKNEEQPGFCFENLYRPG